MTSVTLVHHVCGALERKGKNWTMVSTKKGGNMFDEFAEQMTGYADLSEDYCVIFVDGKASEIAGAMKRYCSGAGYLGVIPVPRYKGSRPYVDCPREVILQVAPNIPTFPVPDLCVVRVNLEGNEEEDFLGPILAEMFNRPFKLLYIKTDKNGNAVPMDEDIKPEILAAATITKEGFALLDPAIFLS